MLLGGGGGGDIAQEPGETIEDQFSCRRVRG